MFGRSSHVFFPNVGSAPVS